MFINNNSKWGITSEWIELCKNKFIILLLIIFAVERSPYMLRTEIFEYYPDRFLSLYSLLYSISDG